MMKQHLIKNGIFLLLPVLIFTRSQAQVDTVLNRYRQYLLATVQRVDISPLLTTVNINGQWTDINYQDLERSGWQVSKHLERLRDISLQWADPQSGYYHSPQLKAIINATLDHWLEKRYKNPNWWHNEIGVPRYTRDILILLYDSLSARQHVQALGVLGQYQVHSNSTGANLTWSADLGFHYGALTGNDTLMQQCSRLLVKEIRITTAEGVQPDHSFHQHGPRLQMYQYGGAFLTENVRLAWQLRNTRWAFPKETVNVLADLVLKGWQWMARGIHTVPGTMDRSASRVNALHGADIRSLIPYLCELKPEQANEFRAIADRQNEQGTPLQGFRYFPRSDFTAYQNNHFSFFLKTISNRTLATESINSENLKGKLLNSGDAYVIQNGNEYFNLMPVWNWKLLPGITAFTDADKIIRQPFTGSVANENSGLTVMDYQLKGTGKQLLSAKKFWACYKEVVICLIAGLQQTNIQGDIYTALDQCRWQGPVAVNTTAYTLREANHHLGATKWIYHHNLAYIFLQPAVVNLQLNRVTGTWTSINASGPSTPVTEKIFLPVMQHAVRDEPLSTGYVLAYCSSAAAAQQIAKKPSWKIVRNDSSVQAVQFNDGTIMSAFYQPGTLVVNAKARITVNKACLILVSGNTVYASNPAQQQEELIIDIGKASKTIRLPGDGTTVSVELPK